MSTRVPAASWSRAAGTVRPQCSSAPVEEPSGGRRAEVPDVPALVPERRRSIPVLPQGQHLARGSAIPSARPPTRKRRSGGTRDSMASGDATRWSSCARSRCSGVSRRRPIGKLCAKSTGKSEIGTAAITPAKPVLERGGQRRGVAAERHSGESDGSVVLPSDPRHETPDVPDRLGETMDVVEHVVGGKRDRQRPAVLAGTVLGQDGEHDVEPELAMEPLDPERVEVEPRVTHRRPVDQHEPRTRRRRGAASTPRAVRFASASSQRSRPGSPGCGS